MKCVFTRDMDVNPKTLSVADKAKVKFRASTVNGNPAMIPFFPAGTEYEHPQAALFVRKGCAAPADDECREKCGMTPEQIEQAQHLYQRNAAGIRPEDYELFDNGVITGYTQEGVYVPGPTWEAYQQARNAKQNALTQSDI